MADTYIYSLALRNANPTIDRNEIEKKTIIKTSRASIIMQIATSIIAFKGRNNELFKISNYFIDKNFNINDIADGSTSTKSKHSKYNLRLQNFVLTEDSLDKFNSTRLSFYNSNTHKDLLMVYNNLFSLYGSITGKKNSIIYYFSESNQYFKFILAYYYLSYIPSPNEHYIVLMTVLEHYNKFINDRNITSELCNALSIKYKMKSFEIEAAGESSKKRKSENKKTVMADFALPCCFLCGKFLEYKTLTEDFDNKATEHIIPVAIAWIVGAIHSPFNYEYSHKVCNSIKSNNFPITIDDIVMETEERNALKRLIENTKINISFDDIKEELVDKLVATLDGIPAEFKTPENYKNIIKLLKEKFINEHSAHSGGRSRDDSAEMYEKTIMMNVLLSKLKIAVKNKSAFEAMVLLELIKYFTIVSKCKKMHKYKISGGTDEITKYFESFCPSNTYSSVSQNNLRYEENAPGVAPYMSTSDRVNYYKYRIIRLDEASHILHEKTNEVKNEMKSYEEFIIERYQRILNFHIRKNGISFYD